MAFLSYDVRSIQRFLFAIPRLRYIVGGSALVDRFDRETAASVARRHGAECIHTGGGKGVLCAGAGVLDALEGDLVGEAARIGLDLRIGRHLSSYSEAIHGTSATYSYLPSDLDGPPCPASGLYPVSSANVEAHPVVTRRVFGGSGDEDRDLRRRFERRLMDGASGAGGAVATLGQRLAERLGLGSPDGLRFFRDVDRVEMEDSYDEGYAAYTALGSRGRWAVVAMDGNDMGRQFAARSELSKEEGEGASTFARMGAALDRCSVAACRAGIEAVVEAWFDDLDRDTSELPRVSDPDVEGGEAVLLPIRPLVVGGDDIAVLCHGAYAFDFVEAACATFAETSRTEHAAAVADGLDGGLWPATGGGLTISCGLVFCSITLPLAASMEYAEALLASAKAGGRRAVGGPDSGEPSPAFVDFEILTESFVDDPATRRQRELVFVEPDPLPDADSDPGPEPGSPTRVELTRRPYSLGDLKELLAIAEGLEFDVPRSISQSLLRHLRAGFWDRRVFHARLAKNHPELARWLDETRGAEGSRWRDEEIEVDGQPTRVRSTDLVDAVAIGCETNRYWQPVVEGAQ